MIPIYCKKYCTFWYTQGVSLSDHLGMVFLGTFLLDCSCLSSNGMYSEKDGRRALALVALSQIIEWFCNAEALL